MQTSAKRVEFKYEWNQVMPNKMVISIKCDPATFIDRDSIEIDFGTKWDMHDDIQAMIDEYIQDSEEKLGEKQKGLAVMVYNELMRKMTDRLEFESVDLENKDNDEAQMDATGNDTVESAEQSHVFDYNAAALPQDAVRNFEADLDKEFNQIAHRIGKEINKYCGGKDWTKTGLFLEFEGRIRIALEYYLQAVHCFINFAKPSDQAKEAVLRHSEFVTKLEKIQEELKEKASNQPQKE